MNYAKFVDLVGKLDTFMYDESKKEPTWLHTVMDPTIAHVRIDRLIDFQQEKIPKLRKGETVNRHSENFSIER